MSKTNDAIALIGLTIPEVKLLPQLLQIEDIVSRTCEYSLKVGRLFPILLSKAFFWKARRAQERRK